MEIKRDIHLRKLIESKHNGMIKVVTGVRRCGKSYLLTNLFRRHLLSDGVAEDHIVEINLEDKKSASLRNPNKLHGEIYHYSELYSVMGEILAAAGIDEYSLIRADLRLDSFDPKHYEQYAKLNKYLISALAVTYSVKNCYRSTDLFSQAQLSIAIKNRHFEAENYDKEAESGGSDVAKSRLELRSKSFEAENLPNEFTGHWFLRLDKALTNLDRVQARYNDELIRLYHEGKDADPCQFRSVTDFIIMYKDCIFTKAQLIDLLSRIPEVGPDKAKVKAENHKKRYGIEFFSLNDMRAAVGEIKRATIAFFRS